MTAKLRAVSFPHLEKPFLLSGLREESRLVVAISQENNRRVRAALALMKTRAEALQAAMEESRRLFGESMQQSGRAGGRTRR
jgi:hypothetical protein